MVSSNSHWGFTITLRILELSIKILYVSTFDFLKAKDS